MRQWIEQASEDDTATAANLDPWPIARTPEQIILCVGGGYHPTHNFWMQAYASNIAGRKFILPACLDALITAADTTLGHKATRVKCKDLFFSCKKTGGVWAIGFLRFAMVFSKLVVAYKPNHGTLGNRFEIITMRA